MRCGLRCSHLLCTPGSVARHHDVPAHDRRRREDALERLGPAAFLLWQPAGRTFLVWQAERLPHMAGAPSAYGRSAFRIWQERLPHMEGAPSSCGRDTDWFGDVAMDAWQFIGLYLT